MDNTEPERIDKLCERCESLELHTFIERTYHLHDENDIKQMEAPVHIMPNQCALCAIFSSLYPRDTSSGLGPYENSSQLKPWCSWKKTRGPYSQRLLRFASFHIKENGNSGLNEAFLSPMELSFAKDKEQFSTQKLARTNSVDLNQVKDWLAICDTKHAHCRAKHQTVDGMRPRPPLRVIDCRTRNIRFAETNEPYVCLSYMWGNTTDSDEASRDCLPATLPRTIQDAISVSLALGIPRLWVDRYCITQDNDQERHDAIASMDLIYGGASLTIIAASATSSHSGLPGISKTPRKPFQYLRLPNCSFAVLDQAKKQIGESEWNTRGWTYQEVILSPRKLVFTESGVYFQCRKMYRYGGAVVGDYYVWDLAGVGRRPSDIYNRIEEYLPRELSFEYDRLNAFHGIVSAYDHVERAKSSNQDSEGNFVKHFYGIPLLSCTSTMLDGSLKPFDPVTSFISGLIWTVPSSLHTQSTLPAHTAFPSWSWASSKAAGCTGWNDKIWYGNLYGLSKQADAASSTHLHADYRITHRDGEVVSLPDFMTRFRSRSYKEFAPWIDVSAWTLSIQRPSFPDGVEHGFIGMGRYRNTLFLDGYGPPGETEIVAIPLSSWHQDGPPWNAEPLVAVVLLLVCELAPGTYSRWGLWQALQGEDQQTANVEELMHCIVKDRPLGHTVVVERRTLRLV